MHLTSYEQQARREAEAWARDTADPVRQALDTVTRPLDWLLGRTVPSGALDAASEAIGEFLGALSDGAKWTYDEGELLKRARKAGLEAETLDDLREAPLERLDPLARATFTEHSVMAAVEGGGTGLGGAALIAADIPLLFGVQLRLIQQILGFYGFPLRGPEGKPLVLHILNASSAGTVEARQDALREVSVAGTVLAHGGTYKGRAPSGTLRDQSRNLPREIAKSLVGRKLLQTIPVAGAAVGASVNYWLTRQTADTAYHLGRSLYLEHKDRR